MATATATLAASFSSSLCINHKQYPLPISLSKPNLPFLSSFSSSSSSSSLSPQRLAISPLNSSRRTPLSVAKSSESEAESADSPGTETAQLEKPAPPKREEIFAVVMVGSRQYIVIPGRWLYTQRLKGANVNDKIKLNKVLLVGTKTTTYIGKPIVTNAAVHAVVEEQTVDDKVIVFKYKPKKNYRRNIGHRQPITRIRITGITGYEDYPAVTLEQTLADMEAYKKQNL